MDGQKGGREGDRDKATFPRGQKTRERGMVPLYADSMEEEERYIHANGLQCAGGTVTDKIGVLQQKHMRSIQLLLA